MARLKIIMELAGHSNGVSVLLVLAWLATCDGPLSTSERKELESIAADGECGHWLGNILDIASTADVSDLQLACEELRKAPQDERRSCLQLAIEFSLEDGVLASAEGHVIRLLADLFGFGRKELDEVFKAITGKPFPSAADPSSPEWWAARTSREEPSAKSERSDSQARSTSRSSPQGDLARLRDLAMLGLDETASAMDIRDAFRRMAKIHHPDRFESLGPEAVRAADRSFQRIREAYERLASG